MKKLFFVFLVFIILNILINAADEFDFNDIPNNVKYCQVIGVSMGFDTPPIITINFGQKWIARKVIKRDGKVFSFNNMIDVLNWMYENGWEYKSYFYISGGISGNYHIYLLQRKE